MPRKFPRGAINTKTELVGRLCIYTHAYIYTRIKPALRAQMLTESYYRIILQDYITALYYGMILQDNITEIYHGIVLRDNITESYHGIILRDNIKE